MKIWRWVFFRIKAGCKLIDMEMVQFHPTGMISEDIAGTLVTEAVKEKVENF